MEVTESIVESEVWTELDNILSKWAEHYEVKKVDLEAKTVLVEFSIPVTIEIVKTLTEYGTSFEPFAHTEDDNADILFDVIIDHENEYIGLVEH